MAPIVLPKKIQRLLADCDLEAPTKELARSLGALFDRGSMPFFPAFTDHSRHHVEHVLQAAERLIPQEVWDPQPPGDSELLQPADAAVLACSAMLHDSAMYLQEQGFVELVESGSPFEPSPWFSNDQENRPRDLPWPELWQSFQREARLFGTSQIELLFGPDAGRVPKVAYEEPLEPSNWDRHDYLLIGEFLRRHHGRLSHEIALHGYPGGGEEFPLLSDLLPDLADGIGVVARSHSESLRTMLAYLRDLEGANQRPGGALLPYHMAVLRIADYLQIQAERAPPLLLRLKAPLSPLSVAEWDKNKAVADVSWNHGDARAIFFRISPQHGLRTHLALAELLDDLQHELDTANAVLSETYSGGELQKLTLSRNRVTSNLEMESLRKKLSYVPRKAVLKSDPDLFRLVVRDLYGNHPAVAGRELIQNAVDAVRMRRNLEMRRGTEAPEESSAAEEADVFVCLEEEDDRCVLQVTDRGIGMTPDQVIEFFLQAGASFGPAPEEIEELDRDEALAAMRAGRFGIGAFAAFLLGSEINVTTRHLDAERVVSFSAGLDADLIQLDWTAAPIGTQIAIHFDPAVIPGPRWAPEEAASPREFLTSLARFYRLSWPRLRLVHRSRNEAVEIPPPADAPIPDPKTSDPWRPVQAPGFDVIFWKTDPSGPRLIHNGMEIVDLSQQSRSTDVYDWSDERLEGLLRKPSLAVFDSRHSLGIALNRYGLLKRQLPFEEELLQSIGADLVAFARAAGPEPHPILERQDCTAVFSRKGWIPVLPDLLRRNLDQPLLVLWHVPPDADSGPGGTSPATATFLEPDSPISWDDFPYRLVRSGSDRSFEQVPIWAPDFARQIGGRELASWFSIPRKPPYVPRKLGEAPRKGSGGFSGMERERSLERKLVTAAVALGSKNGKRLGLSTLGGFGQDPKQELLAKPWLEEIGGWMPRQP